MTYLQAFSKVLPILLILILGAFFNRRRFLRPETVQDLKKLVINVTLPVLLFLAFSQVDLEPQYLLIVGLVFLACLLALLVGWRIQPLTGIQLPPPFVIPLFMQGAELDDRNFVVNSLTLATVVTLVAFTLISVLYAPGAG